MKTGIFIATALSTLASALPAREVEKRAVVTTTAVAQVTEPVVYVYVNQAGQPVLTSTANVVVPVTTSSQPTSTPAASSTASAPAPPAYSAAPSSPPSAAAGSSMAIEGNGISYSPYNSDGTCKTAAQVASDFAVLNNYSVVRIYGTDCNQVSNVLAAAERKGMKIFAGIFDITQTAASVQTIIQAAKNNWGSIHTVSIGNEGVNDGSYTVDAVTSAIGTARSMLRTAGYQGPVVTVDTFVAVLNNPALCQASDYAAVNCHAFFDSETTADQAGSYVLQQANAVSKACGGKHTIITESGWPSNGDANGLAVPSAENQRAAIASLQSSLPNNMVLFSAFDNTWQKNNAYTFGAEQYWGIHGNAPSSN